MSGGRTREGRARQQGVWSEGAEREWDKEVHVLRMWTATYCCYWLCNGEAQGATLRGTIYEACIKITLPGNPFRIPYPCAMQVTTAMPVAYRGATCLEPLTADALYAHQR